MEKCSDLHEQMLTPMDLIGISQYARAWHDPSISRIPLWERFSVRLLRRLGSGQREAFSKSTTCRSGGWRCLEACCASVAS